MSNPKLGALEAASQDPDPIGERANQVGVALDGRRGADAIVEVQR